MADGLWLAAHLNCKCKIGEDWFAVQNPHLNCKCKIGEDFALTGRRVI